MTGSNRGQCKRNQEAHGSSGVPGAREVQRTKKVSHKKIKDVLITGHAIIYYKRQSLAVRSLILRSTYLGHLHGRVC